MGHGGDIAAAVARRTPRVALHDDPAPGPVGSPIPVASQVLVEDPRAPWSRRSHPPAAVRGPTPAARAPSVEELAFPNFSTREVG